MKLKVQNGIVSMVFPTQYECNATMIRIQEFYESPYKNIRGKHFSLETYMDLYAKENGNFTYFSDWKGFNIPGHIIQNFFDLFGDLSRKEEKFLETVSPFIKSNTRFYVIATCKEFEKNVIPHELAHAMYYLNSDYKTEVDGTLKKLSPDFYMYIYVCVSNMGYGKNVIPDEINAYLSTSTDLYLKERVFKEDCPHVYDLKPFQSLYRRYLKNFKRKT